MRADISQVRLHPNFTNTKVACAAAEGHQRPVEVPGGELGGSDGPRLLQTGHQRGHDRRDTLLSEQTPKLGCVNPRRGRNVRRPGHGAALSRVLNASVRSHGLIATIRSHGLINDGANVAATSVFGQQQQPWTDAGVSAL